MCFVPLAVLFCILLFGFKLKSVHLLLALLMGLISVLPISVIQFFSGYLPFFRAHTLSAVLLKSVLLYGMIEELIKFGLTFPLPHKDYSERDFLFLAFFMGLSLGCFESVIYYLDHFQMSRNLGGVLQYKPVLIRMFTSDLIHMFCSGLLGLFVWEKRNRDIRLFLIFMAVILHGLYDFFAGFSNNFRFFSFAVILFAAVECRIRYSMYNSYEK